jgi:hypothetical protein
MATTGPCSTDRTYDILRSERRPLVAFHRTLSEESVYCGIST